MTTFNMETIANLFNGAIEQDVKLAEIITDAGTQQRAAMDKQAIENYTAAMENGEADNFPAIKLVRLSEDVTMKDGSIIQAGALVLVDGFHRVGGAVGAKLQTFKAEIADGTLQDAIYFSMTANSQNGVNLKGKDYQQAIKKLYTMDGGYWREHGRKKEIASLFGCSTKTVERAVSAIDKATKAEAFKLFEQGASDDEVAAASFKSLKTIKQWREEWEKTQQDNQGSQGGEQGAGEQGTNQEEHTNAGDDNPLNLTFEQVLKLKNKDLQRKLLALLMDACGVQEQAQEEPQQEAQEEPQEEPESVDANPTDAIANEWRGLDWWDILGLDLAALNGLKNPKAAIKRAYNKQLKRVHSDKYGENEALEILKDALAAANKMFK